MSKPTFVLVHGAWQSAATWDGVVPLIEASGCPVITPELSGLEKTGSLTKSVNLSTHIDDVARALERAPGEVILVGHSYAGMIVTGVAEKATNVARVVYVDAFIPGDGESVLDLMPTPIALMFRARAVAAGDGWTLPADEAQLDLWGLPDGEAREFVRARLTDFSLNCFDERIRLPQRAAERLPRSYIACVGAGYPAKPVFDRFAEHARSHGWPHFELATGHDCHVEKPEQFVSILLRQIGA